MENPENYKNFQSKLPRESSRSASRSRTWTTRCSHIFITNGVNQKIKHAKPAKQWRARYLLFTLSNLIKIDTRDINTTCFPLLKTNPNFVKSVLCSINSYDNFEKTYVHRITSSTQWWCNGTQISSKTQFFGPEKNFAARAPLATTSKL